MVGRLRSIRVALLTAAAAQAETLAARLQRDSRSAEDAA